MPGHEGPRLPLELLRAIVAELTVPCTYGDPAAASALAACCLVSRAMREFALEARYFVVVSPRHAREFRKYVQRHSADMVGYTKALFVALDDTGKLTSMSAGWDTELKRLLQRVGPHLLHLSLWQAETRSVLDDVAQLDKSWHASNHYTDDDGNGPSTNIHVNARRRQNVARMMKQIRQGLLLHGEALSSVPLHRDTNDDNSDAQTRAEIQAAKERARQTLPNWLRQEIDATDSANEIKKWYRPQFVFNAREYEHELLAAKEVKRKRSLARQDLHDQQQLDLTSIAADDEREEVTLDWSCMPAKLSICQHLKPVLADSEVARFPRLSLFVRVQELDVDVAVPHDAMGCLHLLSTLIASPIRWFRFSTLHGAISIALGANAPYNAEFRQWETNIAAGLHAILASETLRSVLYDLFVGRRIDDINAVERAIASAVAASRTSSLARRGKSESHDHGGLAACLSFSNSNFVHVDIEVTKDVGRRGKLRERRQEFLQAAFA